MATALSLDLGHVAHRITYRHTHLVAILLTFFGSSSEVWQHLRSTVLTEYIFQHLGVLLCVAVVSSLIGVPCAWLTATRYFPGRSIFAWALILPFAAPAYMVAYAYADMLDYAGPLQTWLRGIAAGRLVISAGDVAGAVRAARQARLTCQSGAG